jgi:hypothetical protein
MSAYSFIDFGNRDFLRDIDGDVIIEDFDSFNEAEDWLLENGEHFGWTNSGVKYWNWDEEG